MWLWNGIVYHFVFFCDQSACVLLGRPLRSGRLIYCLRESRFRLNWYRGATWRIPVGIVFDLCSGSISDRRKSGWAFISPRADVWDHAVSAHDFHLRISFVP
jgi:hypothetical protein